MIKRVIQGIQLILIWASLIFPLALQGQTGYPAPPSHKQSDAIITHKVFYVLDAMRDPSWNRTLGNDSMLNNLGAGYLQRVRQALGSTGQVSTLSAALQWTDTEIAQVSRRLSVLCQNSGLKGLAKLLRKSKRYQTSNALPDTALIARAWEESARGINQVVRVYLGGQQPRYPAIDSIAFNIYDPGYLPYARKTLSPSLNLDMRDNSLFFEPALRLALDILEMNGRNEAARYEPLTQGLNQPAHSRMRTIDWSGYPYSALLVPGFGPESPETRIDYRSIARCKWAADAFRQGKAPFIIVSGGHVYPHKTPYSEAVEMRRYLIDSLGISEASIIIEPHARHTTTNIRNAARLIYRMDMPARKPVLVVTDTAQRKMIENLESRCLRELGFVPYKQVKTITNHQIEFYPVIAAFEANEMDVLDP